MVKKRWSVRSRKGWQRWKGIAPGLPPSLGSLGSKTSRFTQRRVCHRLIATRYYLATLAVQQKSPTVRFRSGAEMLETFGLQKGGKEYRRLVSAFEQIFGAT